MYNVIEVKKYFKDKLYILGKKVQTFDKNICMYIGCTYKYT